MSHVSSSASHEVTQRVSFSCQSYIYDNAAQSVRLCDSTPSRWDVLQVSLTMRFVAPLCLHRLAR